MIMASTAKEEAEALKAVVEAEEALAVVVEASAAEAAEASAEAAVAGKNRAIKNGILCISGYKSVP